jgi:hypothetical protein
MPLTTEMAAQQTLSPKYDLLVNSLMQPSRALLGAVN